MSLSRGGNHKAAPHSAQHLKGTAPVLAAIPDLVWQTLVAVLPKGVHSWWWVDQRGNRLLGLQY